MTLRALAAVVGDNVAFHDQAPRIFPVEAFDLWATTPKVRGFTVANCTPIYEKIEVAP